MCEGLNSRYTMNLVDTHVHLNAPEYASDWRQLADAAEAEGVGAFIIPSEDAESSLAAAVICRKDRRMLFAAGLHPHEAGKLSDSEMAAIEALLPEAAAVGEIGLDYHYDFSPRSRQLECFKANLELACRHDLPVIIHVREADSDMLELLSTLELPPKRGVIHCCTSGWESAQKYLELGFYIGITGMVTFKKMTDVHETAAKCPKDRLLLETDGPYLAPVPHRGARCEPAWINLTADRIAELRGLKREELIDSCSANACRLFGSRLQDILVNN